MKGRFFNLVEDVSKETVFLYQSKYIGSGLWFCEAASRRRSEIGKIALEFPKKYSRLVLGVLLMIKS